MYEVLRDVQLVWSNCYLFNSRPEDLEVREMCDEAQQCFDALWDSAGLLGAEAASAAKPAAVHTEEDLPPSYSMKTGLGTLPPPSPLLCLYSPPAAFCRGRRAPPSSPGCFLCGQRQRTITTLPPARDEAFRSPWRDAADGLGPRTPDRWELK